MLFLAKFIILVLQMYFFSLVKCLIDFRFFRIIIYNSQQHFFKILIFELTPSNYCLYQNFKYLFKILLFQSSLQLTIHSMKLSMLFMNLFTFITNYDLVLPL